MNYAELINPTTAHTLFTQAGKDNKQAEFIANLKNTALFLHASNLALAELLEEYAITTDGQARPLKTPLVINALYTLRNNLQIAGDLGEFIEFYSHTSNATGKEQTQ